MNGLNTTMFPYGNVISCAGRGMAFLSKEKDCLTENNGLWKEIMGEAVTVCDSFPIPVIRENNGIYCPNQSNEKIKLTHIVFFEKDGNNKIEPCYSIKDTIKAFENCFDFRQGSTLDTLADKCLFLFAKAPADYETVQLLLVCFLGKIEEQLNSTGFHLGWTTGDSMMPMLRQGVDRVVVRQITAPLKRYDAPLYRRKDHLTLHRLVKINDDGSYIMRGDNRIFNETDITDNEIIGVLETIIRPDGLLRTEDREFIRFAKRAESKYRIITFFNLLDEYRRVLRNKIKGK